MTLNNNKSKTAGSAALGFILLLSLVPLITTAAATIPQGTFATPTPINGIILAPEHLQEISNLLAPTAAEAAGRGGGAEEGGAGTETTTTAGQQQGEDSAAASSITTDDTIGNAAGQ